MRKNVTIVDVAKLAGVSLGTASQAFNMKPGVSQAATDKVLAAARKLKYFPSSAAQGLKRGKTNLFSLHLVVGRSDSIHPSTWDFYFPVIQGFVNEFRANDCRVHLEIDTLDDLASGVTLLNYLKGQNIQGCAFVVTTKGKYEMLEVIMKEYAIPVATVYSKVSASVPSVTIDNYHAAYEMTSWLLRIGHREIAFIGGPESDYAAADRLKGYKDAMRRLPRVTQEGTWDFDSGDEGLRKIFSSRRIPTAIFCANDHMALGVLSACKDLRIQVPDRVSLAGFDGTFDGSSR